MLLSPTQTPAGDVAVKMPKRPWYPDLKPRPDIFGLHYVTLMHAACESDAERQQRVAKVEAGVKAAYAAAVHHLGEDAARSLFLEMTRAQKRGRGKALAPDRDASPCCRLMMPAPTMRAFPRLPGVCDARARTSATPPLRLKSTCESSWPSEKSASTRRKLKRVAGEWRFAMSRQRWPAARCPVPGRGKK